MSEDVKAILNFHIIILIVWYVLCIGIFLILLFTPMLEIAFVLAGTGTVLVSTRTMIEIWKLKDE